MAKASVRWTGLDELKAFLRTLPADLAQEGNAIVYSHARMAQQEVANAYPVVSGNLARNVRVTIDLQSRYGARALVKSAAKHAWLYEHGTEGKIRYYSGTDKRGRVFKQASRGAMPEAPREKQAIPKFIRWRTRMYAQLAAMVERHGFVISGSFRGVSRAA